jgi:hypothetical protein
MKEFRRVFENNIPFVSSLSRNYDDTWKALGAKSGESIRIPRPMRYTARSGKTMDVQDYTENQATLTKATIRGVDLKFSWAEASQNLEGVMKNHIRPAAQVLASTVENVVMTTAYQEVYNTITIPTTAMDKADITAAAEMLNDFSTPSGNRYGVITTASQAQLLNDNSGIYNPQASVSRQYQSGVIGPAYGFDLAASAVIPSMTNSADVAGAVNGASQTGATLVVEDLTVAPTQGAVCTIGDDVFSLNPVTQASTGKLQRFVVGSGATTTSLPISPSITVTGNQKTVSAVPDNDDVISFVGSASTAYPQQLFYHRDAFAFGTCDFQVPADLTSVRTNTNGLAMVFTSGGDIVNMDEYHRLDIMFGLVTVIPEWACKVYGI